MGTRKRSTFQRGDSYNTWHSADGGNTHQSTLHNAIFNLSSGPDHSVQAIAAANAALAMLRHTCSLPPHSSLSCTPQLHIQTRYSMQRSKDSPSDPSHFIRAGPAQIPQVDQPILAD